LISVNDLCGVRNSPLARSLEAEPAKAAAVSLPRLSNRTDHAIGGKILGGAPVGGIQYPWMAAITFDGSHICSGTLVSRQWVMTAAHCVSFL